MNKLTAEPSADCTVVVLVSSDTYQAGYSWQGNRDRFQPMHFMGSRTSLIKSCWMVLEDYLFASQLWVLHNWRFMNMQHLSPYLLFFSAAYSQANDSLIRKWYAKTLNIFGHHRRQCSGGRYKLQVGTVVRWPRLHLRRTWWCWWLRRQHPNRIHPQT